MEDNHTHTKTARDNVFSDSEKLDAPQIWERMQSLAREISRSEVSLKSLLEDVVLGQSSLGDGLAMRLTRKLERADMSREELHPLLQEVIGGDDSDVVQSVMVDLLAIESRDPACPSALEPFLFFKGFLALTTYRIAHSLWNMKRISLARYFQSLSSEVFGVDIHPAAQIGCGILLDHATGLVIGETAIVENGVSILHGVTLGGTGKEAGNRHPIVRSGVLIGAGAKILGRVEIGEGAKVGAGSVVLTNVQPHVTVAGVPAVEIGTPAETNPAEMMNQSLINQSLLCSQGEGI